MRISREMFGVRLNCLSCDCTVQTFLSSPQDLRENEMQKETESHTHVFQHKQFVLE